MMKSPLLGTLCILALVLTACGGSELKPEQQREYDALQEEKQSLSSEIRAEDSRSKKAYKALGAMESRKKILTKEIVICGVSANGQAFGPFPWGQKRRAKLVEGGSQKMGAQDCKRYKVKVTP